MAETAHPWSPDAHKRADRDPPLTLQELQGQSLAFAKEAKLTRTQAIHRHHHCGDGPKGSRLQVSL
ncbi:hypothetical protein PMIT1306_00221 [Prochlorococcus sp. MIT 1306]|nr:hypothetical protein PMIT1306_00221 [Prochlorococcus sp. MIT 1306]